MMRVASILSRLAAFAIVAAPAVAWAEGKDDLAACVDAASTGQSLRDTHKLLEAREQFRSCARAQCPSVVQRDCAGWLDAAEKSLPTVVIAAKSAAGADLVDVAVTLDGQPFVAKLDGTAVAMNPGAHTLHFEASGVTLDQTVVVKEGEKDRTVAVVLGPAPAQPAPTPATAAFPANPSAASSPGHEPTSSTWKTVGWVLGGAGVVGVVVGVAFGVEAMAKKSDAQCDAQGFCNAGPLSDARTAGNVSTASFVLGGVLLAGSVGVLLLAPRSEGAQGLRVRIGPTVGSAGGGFALSGGW